TLQQMKAISMFEDFLGSLPPVGAGQQHPIEKLQGIHRPTGQDMYDNFTTLNKDHKHDAGLNPFFKTAWDSFATELSDPVTLINQQNQIQMNDINSLQKQKDRHFDLANTAVAKATDIIQSIGRNVA